MTPIEDRIARCFDEQSASAVPIFLKIECLWNDSAIRGSMDIAHTSDSVRSCGQPGGALRCLGADPRPGLHEAISGQH
jgi:hypothetical protein